ncbi:unnamed protein product [marine sediment metagenome]|uniref:Uncharacterized protein n=1 Tax=marine sediment metagenome TaxID=412755 RepID=X0ZEB6_9ZZZZ
MPEYVYKVWDKKEKRYIRSQIWTGRYTFMTTGAAKTVCTRWNPRRDLEVHRFRLVRDE